MGGSRLSEPEHRALWEVLDASLWGKPLGLVVLVLGEFLVVSVIAVFPLRVALPMIGGLGYLEIGPWYYTMGAVLLVGLLVLSIVHSVETVRDPGRRLLRRVLAQAPEPGVNAAASGALKQVQLAAGLSPYPRLRVYSSPFPNGFSYCGWDGRITVCLSTELAASLGVEEWWRTWSRGRRLLPLTGCFWVRRWSIRSGV
jgi:Zn-dependent protease with chaperone function